ncbi:protein FRA10AC1 [Bombina bombina]|uniref:protein FRA10AC1 n=1 Tax=Bombina bombina TaxID=8345 RepID=UPI00235A56DD|nr:protein FRA10AC1 [Bombina bombina]
MAAPSVEKRILTNQHLLRVKIRENGSEKSYRLWRIKNSMKPFGFSCFLNIDLNLIFLNTNIILARSCLYFITYKILFLFCAYREKKLAKKYYDKLFKEYCIADLSKYKENKFGFRWRVEKELVSGKGQFSCGNKRCDEKEGLKSWEVNFGYVEHGEKKNALVKLRLCPECSYKLNFHHRRREVEPKSLKRKTQEEYGEPSRKKSKKSRSPKKTKGVSPDKHKDSSEKASAHNPALNTSERTVSRRTERKCLRLQLDQSSV